MVLVREHLKFAPTESAWATHLYQVVAPSKFHEGNFPAVTGGVGGYYYGREQRMKSKSIVPALLSPNAGWGRSFSLPRYIAFMSQPMNQNGHKNHIQIDVVSDTVCPWCFVGKKNLDKAIDLTKDRFDFEVKWHPFILSPSAPKEGMKKSDFYKEKFGHQYESIAARMKEVFQGLGYEYDLSGLWGSTLDSHRLITFAGNQGSDEQSCLVEELFMNYFTEGKYINDRQVLLEAARKAGIEGAEELLEDPNKGLTEVQEELERYSRNITGVPHFVINGKLELSGGQPTEVFLRAFEAVTK